MVCRHCGKQISPEDAHYCTDCGADYCTNCAAHLCDCLGELRRYS